MSTEETKETIVEEKVEEQGTILGQTIAYDFRTIAFPEEITDETGVAFINEVEAALTMGSNVHIYISSVGGTPSISMYMANILNMYMGIYTNQIIMVFTGDLVASSALLFLRELNAPVHVGDHTIGMLHLPTTMLDARELRGKNSMSAFMNSILENKNKEWLDEWKEEYLLSEEETERLKRGEDVYFTADRMNSLFNTVNFEIMKEEEEVSNED